MNDLQVVKERAAVYMRVTPNPDARLECTAGGILYIFGEQ